MTLKEDTNTLIGKVLPSSLALFLHGWDFNRLGQPLARWQWQEQNKNLTMPNKNQVKHPAKQQFVIPFNFFFFLSSGFTQGCVTHREMVVVLFSHYHLKESYPLKFHSFWSHERQVLHIHFIQIRWSFFRSSVDKIIKGDVLHGFDFSAVALIMQNGQFRLSATVNSV